MNGWHATDAELAAFANGTIDRVGAASVEAHLIACDECRASLAALAAPGTRAERIWAGIADRIDWPSRRASGPWWVRATAGTPTLALVTALLVAAMVAVPVLAGAGSTRVAVVLLFALAPVAPVLGAAAAYRDDVDPAGELAAAAPLASQRLVLVRTAFVLAVAVPVGIGAGVALPLPLSLLTGWLLPGLALCGVVLAAARWIDPARLAAALAGGWVVVIGAAFARTRSDALDVALEQIFVNQRLTQAASALVLLAAAVVVARDRGGVRPGSRPWST